MPLTRQGRVAKVPLAVCSTSNEAAVRTLVETLMGPERYARFSFFCGDVVPRKKPQPDVYNLAAQEMGLDKSECVPTPLGHPVLSRQQRRPSNPSSRLPLQVCGYRGLRHRQPGRQIGGDGVPRHQEHLHRGGGLFWC